LFFKWMMQHLRIKAFYGTHPNALKTPVWSDHTAKRQQPPGDSHLAPPGYFASRQKYHVP